MMDLTEIGFPEIEYYNSHLPEIHENVIREVKRKFY